MDISEESSTASSIVSTTTRFSTNTLDDAFADTRSIDTLRGQFFHLSKDASRISDDIPPSYASAMADIFVQPPTASPDGIMPSLATVTDTGHPQEQLEIEEPSNDTDNDIVYPTGIKFWLSIGSLLLTMIFVGLDLTIVAVAVPALTDYFGTINDIGWYSSAYMLFYASFIFLSAKLYNVFATKQIYLAGICIFQLGSLLCTVATKSGVFILGRAVAGLGACMVGMGGMVIVSTSIPRHKRPMWMSILAGVNSTAMVSAPLVGGALIDAFTWRACFGINLPFGALAIGLTAWGLPRSGTGSETESSLKDKLKRLDLLGNLLLVPGIVCLLIALQWGGIRYGWDNAKVIVMFPLFAIFISMFGYVNYRGKEDATLPPRILKQRTVLGGAWFGACCNGILAVTEAYISIYFQGVKGYSASRSGLLGSPLIAGLLIAGLLSGFATTLVGYYYPFMYATSSLAPIAAGLLTTLDVDDNLVKVLCLLGFLGAAVGLGLNAPVMGVQNVLPTKDIAIGVAITGFAGSMGSALFTCAAAALFQNRLVAEVAHTAPGVNATAFEHGGLTDVREYIGGNKLRQVLSGYDHAIMQTLYFPVALATLTIIGTVTIERRSVKKKNA